jgi:hypothetical protein
MASKYVVVVVVCFSTNSFKYYGRKQTSIGTDKKNVCFHHDTSTSTARIVRRKAKLGFVYAKVCHRTTLLVSTQRSILQ